MILVFNMSIFFDHDIESDMPADYGEFKHTFNFLSGDLTATIITNPVDAFASVSNMVNGTQASFTITSTYYTDPYDFVTIYLVNNATLAKIDITTDCTPNTGALTDGSDDFLYTPTGIAVGTYYLQLDVAGLTINTANSNTFTIADP